MKAKITLIVLTCALLLSFVLGATGTITLAKDDVATPSKDRLIGVFITMEPLELFDRESYINDNVGELLSGGNISETDSSDCQKKFYASLVERSYTNPDTGETSTTKEYVFDGVDGFSYFRANYTDSSSTYSLSSSNGAISDGNVAVNSTDVGESISLEGTIYVSTSAGHITFYFNPIYQTASGEVYAVSGQGMSFGEYMAGASGSQAISEEQTVVNDGKSETISTDVKVNFVFMDIPTSVSVIQLDRDNNIASAQEYAPGNLPPSITVESNTEYIIVETRTSATDGTETVTRELFQSDDNTLFAFSCRDDGICFKQYCDITWND